MPAGQKTKELWKNPEYRQKMVDRHKGTNMKHGFANFKDKKYNSFYGRYNSLTGRCRTKSDKAYKNYGGRGIKCEWKSFEDFKNDMYESYLNHVKEFGKRDTVIDRIDSDKNYSKENCRWITYKENRANNSEYGSYGK